MVFFLFPKTILYARSTLICRLTYEIQIKMCSCWGIWQLGLRGKEKNWN